MFSQRTATPQVSCAEMGPAGIDKPFPERLGVDFNVRNSLKTNQRRLSSMGTSFQTTSTGRYIITVLISVKSVVLIFTDLSCVS